MMRWLIHQMLDRFSRQWRYDVAYMRAMFDTSSAAFRKFGAVSRLSEHREAVPVGVAYAARIAGVLHEDCGPCTQLVVDMASAAGVADDQIAAMLAADRFAMSADVALGYGFARALVERHVDLYDLREEVRRHWGGKGVIDLTFAAQMSRIYPMVKSGMGYAEACSIVRIGATNLVPQLAGAAGRAKVQA